MNITKEHIELSIKTVVAIGGIIAVLFGGWKYLDQRDEIIKQEKLKTAAQARISRKNFLETQFTLYSKAVKVASRLSIYSKESFDDPNFKNDKRDFLRLYWGELAIVEHSFVKMAMNLYRSALLQVDKNKRTESCLNKLKQASVLLARCVRKSLSENWDCKDQTCPWHRDKDANRCNVSVCLSIHGMACGPNPAGPNPCSGGLK